MQTNIGIFVVIILYQETREIDRKGEFDPKLDLKRNNHLI
jgi:hypothetical protein